MERIPSFEGSASTAVEQGTAERNKGNIDIRNEYTTQSQVEGGNASGQNEVKREDESSHEVCCGVSESPTCEGGCHHRRHKGRKSQETVRDEKTHTKLPSKVTPTNHLLSVNIAQRETQVLALSLQQGGDEQLSM
jgi:hypothetical protein